MVVELGVQYYPLHPDRLVEAPTRYNFFLQLREDLASGNLVCSEESCVMLCALALQAELGDFDPTLHGDAYVTRMALLAPPSLPLVRQRAIQQRHETLAHMTTEEAETAFLKLAAQQPVYGMDVHTATITAGDKSHAVVVAVGAVGVTLLDRGSLTHLDSYRWSLISRAKFKSQRFFLTCRIAEHLGKGQKTFLFKCPTRDHAKGMWCSVVRHHIFFSRARKV